MRCGSCGQVMCVGLMTRCVLSAGLRVRLRGRRCVRVGEVFTWAYAPLMSSSVLINLRAPAQLREAAVRAAQESGTTVSDICRDALVVFVATHAAAGAAPVVERSDM